MAGTEDTTGTVECEVQAGASDTEGCGMDASSDDFEVFKRTAALALGAHGMVTDGRLGAEVGCGIVLTADHGAVAREPAAKKKRNKRYSGGPQAKRRVAQYHNERHSDIHLAAADASQSAQDGSEVNGGV